MKQHLLILAILVWLGECKVLRNLQYNDGISQETSDSLIQGGMKGESAELDGNTELNQFPMHDEDDDDAIERYGTWMDGVNKGHGGMEKHNTVDAESGQGKFPMPDEDDNDANERYGFNKWIGGVNKWHGGMEKHLPSYPQDMMGHHPWSGGMGTYGWKPRPYMSGYRSDIYPHYMSGYRSDIYPPHYMGGMDYRMKPWARPIDNAYMIKGPYGNMGYHSWDKMGHPDMVRMHPWSKARGSY